jgi:hypothetical protein
MGLLLKEKLIKFVNMKVKKKLKRDWTSGVRVIRDKSLDKLSDVDLFPEKTKEANKVVANLKWKV